MRSVFQKWQHLLDRYARAKDFEALNDEEAAHIEALYQRARFNLVPMAKGLTALCPYGSAFTVMTNSHVSVNALLIELRGPARATFPVVVLRYCPANAVSFLDLCWAGSTLSTPEG